MRIQRKNFSIERTLSRMRSPRVGAIVAFVGLVRKEDKLRALNYEVYDEMAAKQLERIRLEAQKRFKLVRTAIIHRKGRIPVGEKVIIVACSAPHRKEAFEACQWLLSRIKKIVPIWKEEI